MQYFYLILIIGWNLHLVWSFGYQTSRQLNERLFRDYVSDSKTETMFIEQPIDHFGTVEDNNGTWKMKYFRNLKFFKPGGPVYIYIEGHKPLRTPYFIPNTVFYDLALNTSGAMFHTEHRYYGTSKPYRNINAEKLRYLSSKQALADIAFLIESIKESNSFHNSKIVVFGCSYGGNLAVWMRKLYPNLVDAAVASSAPVLAKKDFYEFMEKVSDDINKYGTKNCLQKVANRFARYQELLSTPQGQDTLKQELNICPDTNLDDLDNQYSMIDHENLYQLEAVVGLPGNIKFLCNFESHSEIKAGNNDNDLNAECLDPDFLNEIHSISNESQEFAWLYQVCTEFGYLTPYRSDKQPFGYIPLKFFVKRCPLLYGSEFNEARMDKGIEETNKLYGGLSPNVTKVIFVNGDMDPWSILSILEDISDDVPARVIPKSTQCFVLFPEYNTDSAEAKATRKFIKNTVKKWIVNN